MQNKGLQEPLSWTQFLSFNQILCMKRHRIDRPTELIPRIFQLRKKTIRQIKEKCIFIKKWFVEKKRNITCRIHQDESVLKISG